MSDAYDEYEESREHGMPVNLVLFRYGSATLSVFGYTDAEQAILKDDVTFEPIPISAGKIAASGTLDRKTLELRVPTTAGIAQLYRAYPPSYPISMTIFRGHINEGAPVEWRSIWVGRVLNGKHEGDGSHQCVLTCEPLATSLRRAALRRHFQLTCTHTLYSTGKKQCNANRSAATFTVLPVDVAENALQIDLPDGFAPPSLIPNFTGGVIEWTTPAGNVEIRTVLEVTESSNGYTVFMTGPTTLLTTQAVRISLGCNHQMDHCSGLHNNIHNFGGCPWIPVQNPIGTPVNPYG